MTDTASTQLRKGVIGLNGALAGTLSNMAPVEGIFIVLVVVAFAMGTLTPWAFLIASVGILVTGWNVAQLAGAVVIRRGRSLDVLGRNTEDDNAKPIEPAPVSAKQCAAAA